MRCGIYQAWRRFGCGRLATVPVEELKRKTEVIDGRRVVVYDEAKMLQTCRAGDCHYEGAIWRET